MGGPAGRDAPGTHARTARGRPGSRSPRPTRGVVAGRRRLAGKGAAGPSQASHRRRCQLTTGNPGQALALPLVDRLGREEGLAAAALAAQQTEQLWRRNRRRLTLLGRQLPVVVPGAAAPWLPEHSRQGRVAEHPTGGRIPVADRGDTKPVTSDTFSTSTAVEIPEGGSGLGAKLGTGGLHAAADGFPNGT